jgi:hypothetical protein
MNAKKCGQDRGQLYFFMVIFSLALFFGAVCNNKSIRIYFRLFYFGLGVTIMIVGLIIIAQLPWNSGFLKLL